MEFVNLYLPNLSVAKTNKHFFIDPFKLKTDHVVSKVKHKYL